MTSQIFPLITKLGLSIIHEPLNGFDKNGHQIIRYTVVAHHLERALEKATVVWGSKDNKSSAWVWFDKQSQSGTDTHKALLIAVEEIKREPKKVEITEEKFKELAEELSIPYPVYYTFYKNSSAVRSEFNIRKDCGKYR